MLLNTSEFYCCFDVCSVIFARLGREVERRVEREKSEKKHRKKEKLVDALDDVVDEKSWKSVYEV